MSDSEIKLFYAQSSEVKNRILAPDEHLSAIDTGAYYVAGPDGKPQAVLTASTSAQGVALIRPDGAASPVDPRQGLLIVGDSRSMFGTYPEGVSYFNPISISDLKGLPIAQLGTGPADLDYNTTRQMLYRAADKSVMWPDAADNYGPWTPLRLGVNKIESGTPEKWVAILVRSLKLMPTTDQTIPVVVTQSPYATETYVTPSLRAARSLRLPAKYCGASGGRLQEFVELLPWYASQAPGCGYFVFRGGTNNITNGDSLDYMTSQAKIVLDGLLALGMRGVVIGETARWGTAVNTALTSDKLATLHSYNKWLYSYCAEQSDSLRYVDAWSLTVDTAYTDGRPVAGVLSDTVHDAETGSAVLLTQPIVDALKSVGAAERPGAAHGDPANLTAGGWMTGTGGTLNTGVSGTVPDKWEAARKTGADAVIASSIEPRNDKAGNFWRCDISTTAGGQVQRLNTTYANRQLISTLGKDVGDSIRLECDFQLLITSGSLSSACVIYFQMWAGGSSLILRSQAKVLAPGLYKIVTPDIEIPIGVTMVQPYVEVSPAANSAATVHIGDVFFK
jgi:hypothetical protein